MPPATIPDTFYLFAFSDWNKILNIIKSGYGKIVSESQISSDDKKYLQFLTVFGDIISNSNELSELFQVIDLFTRVNCGKYMWEFDDSCLVENIINPLLKECDSKYVFEFTVQSFDCFSVERPYNCGDFTDFFYSNGVSLQNEQPTIYLRLISQESQISQFKKITQKLLKEELISNYEKNQLANSIKFFKDNKKPPSKYKDDGIITEEKIQEDIDNSKTIISLAIEGV